MRHVYHFKLTMVFVQVTVMGLRRFFHCTQTLGISYSRLLASRRKEIQCWKGFSTDAIRHTWSGSPIQSCRLRCSEGVTMLPRLSNSRVLHTGDR